MCNISTYPGARIRFLNKHGYESQRGHALAIGLKEGAVYEVKRVDVGSCSSVVYIVGFTDGFNTVMFENADEKPKVDDVAELRKRLDNLQKQVDELTQTVNRIGYRTMPLGPNPQWPTPVHTLDVPSPFVSPPWIIAYQAENTSSVK